MLRPNLAQDAPPTALSVGGIDYPINVDYRVWIDVLRLMRNLITTPTTAEHAKHNIDTIVEIEEKVFGRRIEQPAGLILHEISQFAAGYPSAPIEAGDESGARAYSFEWDLNYIIIAIQTQFGINLTYERAEPFHWWLFLLYFHSLAGEHYILKLMEIRGYNGKDKDLKRQASRFALPKEYSADDQAQLDAFNALFDEGSE